MGSDGFCNNQFKYFRAALLLGQATQGLPLQRRQVHEHYGHARDAAVDQAVRTRTRVMCADDHGGSGEAAGRKLLGEAVVHERLHAEMLARGVRILLGIDDEDGVF